MKLYIGKKGSAILRFCPNGMWMKDFKYVDGIVNVMYKSPEVRAYEWRDKK